MRICPLAGLLISAMLLLSALCFAQSETGSLAGVVSDPKGAVVPEAQVRATRVETNTAISIKTNGSGVFAFPYLQPGHYRVQVHAIGFKEVVLKDVELHVQDKLQRNFSLEVGTVAEIVNVEGGVTPINTQDATVSTVVDHTYVQNMPLNGRSFQDLILLTPGTVTQTPQLNQTGTLGVSGEFSVNGQRTESNYYTVDGVSANTGFSAGAGDLTGPGNSGSLAASTALGTTQSLVSLDALEEFRVQSSTYSAESGRNPGGQFSFVTESGANEWHGGAQDYLRNGFFDAQDWFNDFFGKSQPPIKQNDFGGTLGGPIQIPALYNGKNKSFFFFSYEGLRLRQPQAASINYVPDNSLRESVPPALQPVLNAFPIPNGIDLGNGLAEFIGSWSNPSEINSVSIRLDQQVGDKHRLFFRFAGTGSSDDVRQTNFIGFGDPPSNVQGNNDTNRTYTLGVSSLLSNRINNELRLNYSSSAATQSFRIDNFGGAHPVDLAKLQGISPSVNPAYSVSIGLDFLPNTGLTQGFQSGVQRQWNLVDTVSLSLGEHQLKFGIDYRRLAPIQKPSTPDPAYTYLSEGSAQANSPDFASSVTSSPAYPLYTNFSAFAEDEWRPISRLSLSMGLRWEVNPAPGATNGRLPYTVQGNSLATLSLAPESTPLWQTTWFNFAPRLGAAYLIRDKQNWQTVLRSGGGVYFDTGQQLGSTGYQGPGFTYFTAFSNPFPAPFSVINPPVSASLTPPYQYVPAFPRHLQLPYTIAWNVSLQQALGKAQFVNVSYVGSAGRRLLREIQYAGGPLNPDFQSLQLNQNGLTSDYDSLQLQYQRSLSQGLTALASYTWSHAIDFGSLNSGYPAVRGNSDFDVRHNVSGVLSYDLPNRFQNKFAHALFNNWGVDTRFTARTGFPVTLDGPAFIDPLTGKYNYGGLDLTGQPIYATRCANPTAGLPAQIPCPGGRGINPAAFAPPPGCTPNSCPGAVEGNAPRNFARGLGMWQMNFAVRREFPIMERAMLQFRAEAFNLFNHPNFGEIDSIVGDPTFGEVIATLANSGGVLSPIYQSGGARSMQFALRLTF